jgi:16S rRNA (guanine966-N2)-methyltransferase
VRVISGTFRGRKLSAPKGMQTRPTSDRVKEAMFNIIASLDLLEDATVLDLFAGSGALGIEALSRNACSCTFVEHDRTAIEVLRQNLSITGCGSSTEIISMDVTRALRLLASKARRFSLIFLDPPYASSNAYKTAMEHISDGLLKDNGLLVTESASAKQLPERVGRLTRSDRRVYGDTALDFFILEQTDAT